MDKISYRNTSKSEVIEKKKKILL